MNAVSTFLVKFASLIAWSLSCFDRVLFKGHLPLSRAFELENFVDYILKLRRADFMETLAPQWSHRLVEHAKALAAKAGRTYEYCQGAVDKDAWAKARIAAGAIDAGLVGVLCVMETCPTFKLAYGKDRPGFAPRKAPMRVLYYYFLDRDLGLMHVRLQSWAPFTCQVYVNGHDFVARKLRQQGVSFEQIDNAFVKLGDPARAQRVADRFAKLPWPKILEGYARRVNPLLKRELKNMSHYWVIDQAEYATDILFTSSSALAGLFQRLLEFAVLTFSPRKVFQYLGRKWHERFDGQVSSQYKSVRHPGACIKHFMRNNWLKMYDKLGLMLRVETVINQPGDFKVFRECHHRDGRTSRGWYPMCKGVGNFHHYQSHALACNERYLAALAAVDDPTPTHEQLRVLTERQKKKGRSSAGFNPARQEEAALFAAVLAGDHIAQGFRNKHIRQALDQKGTAHPRRLAAAVGRQLKRLQVRGLVMKVPRTRCWRVTPRGRQTLGDTLRVYRRYSSLAA